MAALGHAVSTHEIRFNKDSFVNRNKYLLLQGQTFSHYPTAVVPLNAFHTHPLDTEWCRFISLSRNSSGFSNLNALSVFAVHPVYKFLPVLVHRAGTKTRFDLNTHPALSATACDQRCSFHSICGYISISSHQKFYSKITLRQRVLLRLNIIIFEQLLFYESATLHSLHPMPISGE